MATDRLLAKNLYGRTKNMNYGDTYFRRGVSPQKDDDTLRINESNKTLNDDEGGKGDSRAAAMIELNDSDI